ncbi:MAG: esterase/lipase family protein [Mycobacterium sp.]
MPRSDPRHCWITLTLAVFAALAALTVSAAVAQAENGSDTGSGSATSAPQKIRPVQKARTAERPAARISRPQTLSLVKSAEAGKPSLQAIRNARQLGRQLRGLTLDVAAVAASAVHSFAAGAATAVGPNTLGGIPYSVARTVARTAAEVSRQLAGTARVVAPTGRFRVPYGVFDTAAFWRPWVPPAGSNDPTIAVSTDRPLPIILVNGTGETQGFNWSVGAPVLANAGYKVYTFNYGSPHPRVPFQSTADIRVSARQLGVEIQRVLAETGAPKVVLIGHSQGGGILPAYYINRMDGAATVSHLIGIAPSNHGTNFNQLAGVLRVPVLGTVLRAAVDLFGPAFMQQMDSSRFQREVYGDGDTRPGVVYTTVASRHDAIVTPYTRQGLVGPNVTNVVIQDRYPGFTGGHLNMLVTPQLWDTVLAALAANAQLSGRVRTELAAA